MTDCIMCQQEKLPLITFDVHEGSEWVCICGALYRLVKAAVLGGTYREEWRHMGTTDSALHAAAVAPMPPRVLSNDEITARVQADYADQMSKRDLEDFLKGIATPTEDGGADILRAIRQRFNINPPAELVHVVLRLEIPGVHPQQTTMPLRHRAAEALSKMTPEGIEQYIISAEPETRR